MGQPAKPQQQPLMLQNSLGSRLQEFRTTSGDANLTWYACGPTVYDVSHMGHARNYITADVIRRVLEDYFGYRIWYVMNVTDVDDKIIVRARRNWLLDRYQTRSADVAAVKRDVAAAVAGSVEKRTRSLVRVLVSLVFERVLAEASLENGRKPALSAGASTVSAPASAGGQVQHPARRKSPKLDELQASFDQERHQVRQAEQTSRSIAAVSEGDTNAREQLLSLGGDALAEQLDSTEGASVNPEQLKAAAAAHARRYEEEFLADMDALGVRRPDVMPRVSDYIPQIVAYIARIQANGIAYERDGSVYFDTAAFERAGHQYGRLAPWAVGSSILSAESEANFATSAKCNPRDFALWKAAKPGEPYWPSQWGNGRPGWHIECSAMASELIGSAIDIHTGGIDLRFPHHENEAEAYYHGEACDRSDDNNGVNGAACGCADVNWVHYFLHLGHLQIEGLKMSKSLKNFITIREALGEYSAKQLRLMMCLQQWGGGMSYGPQSREAMRARERELREFFLDMDVEMRDVAAAVAGGATVPSSFEEPERALRDAILTAEADVDAALCNNIATKDALDALSQLMSAAQKYRQLRSQPVPGGEVQLPQPMLLRKATAFVSRILSVMGLVDAPSDRPGFGAASSGAKGDGGADAVAREDAWCGAVAGVRDRLRAVAQMPQAEMKSAVIELSDRIRDVDVATLGYRLEDRPGKPSAWKRDDSVQAEASQRDEEAAARAAAEGAAKREKKEQTLKLKQTELERMTKLASKPPLQEELAHKYDPASWDADGYPTADKHRAPLSDKAVKQAKKEVDKHRKERSKLSSKPPEYLGDLQQEVNSLAAELAALSEQHFANGSAE